MGSLSLWFHRLFICRKAFMLSKIFNIIKNKLKKKKPEKEATLVSTTQGMFLDNPCGYFLIEVDEEGEFIIGFDSYDDSIKSIEAIGNLLFLINSGSLSNFFVKSLNMWAESSEILELSEEKKEERLAFVALLLSQWNEIHKHYMASEGELEERASHQSVVDPSRVFNLRKYL